MPLHYLDAVIDHHHKDKWTFFDLNGCPAEFMRAMWRLARLDSIYGKASKLEWTTFNTRPVDLVIDSMLNFRNEDDLPVFKVGHNREEPNARRDRYHCIEAWRHAIVLYTRRAFHKEQDAQGLRVIDHVTRFILDHIRCIRATSTTQKQVLLPVFIAGAELGDQDDRHFVRSYCKYWSETARYSQFESGLDWLEPIWRDWTPTTRPTYSWCSKIEEIESDSRTSSFERIRPELLLG